MSLTLGQNRPDYLRTDELPLSHADRIQSEIEGRPGGMARRAAAAVAQWPGRVGDGVVSVRGW